MPANRADGGFNQIVTPLATHLCENSGMTIGTPANDLFGPPPDLFTQVLQSRPIARTPDTHARLNAMAQDIRAFKKLRHYDDRKAAIGELVRALEETRPMESPRPASAPTLSSKLSNLLQLQTMAREISDPDQAEPLLKRSNAMLDSLLADIRQDRAAILPRRKGYPEIARRTNVNRDSEPYIDFMREFVAACDAQPEFKELFPSLFSCRDHAARMIDLYDFTNGPKEGSAMVHRDPQGWVALPSSHGWISRETALLLEQFPFSDLGASSIRYNLLVINKYTSPCNGDLKKAKNCLAELRYAAAHDCRHGIEAIAAAYKHDLRGLGRIHLATENGTAQPTTEAVGPLLDTVHRARWALAADTVLNLAERYRTTLADPNRSGYAAAIVTRRGAAEIDTGRKC